MSVFYDIFLPHAEVATRDGLECVLRSKEGIIETPLIAQTLRVILYQARENNAECKF